MPVLRIVDSITELSALDAGCVAVSGSHGGVSSGRFALQAAPRLAVFNDAGVGFDSAGIAGLSLLQSIGMAAATVSHHSARIADGADTLASGVISQANAAAQTCGVRADMHCREAARRLQDAAPASAQLPLQHDNRYVLLHRPGAIARFVCWVPLPLL